MVFSYCNEVVEGGTFEFNFSRMSMTLYGVQLALQERAARLGHLLQTQFLSFTKRSGIKESLDLLAVIYV